MTTFSAQNRRPSNGEQPVRKPALIRCAIYTRKSSEEGLEQEFNSLDAQRESGEAYIASQKAEGWVCLPDKYDDGGYTGGNMERPAVQQLMADIDAGKVDCVVVYKVDRLSRSLMDFARMMSVFERKKVSFVSVTQQFNTTHSMGRLTLNILLSFAQFERELVSERTRDKIALSRRRAAGAAGRRSSATTSRFSPAATRSWSTSARPSWSARSSTCTWSASRFRRRSANWTNAASRTRRTRGWESRPETRKHSSATMAGLPQPSEEGCSRGYPLVNSKV